MADRPAEDGVSGRLRAAIQGCGRSLNALSKESGVGRDRLSRFVRGERDLTLGAADALCRVLGLTLTSAAEGELAPPPAEVPPPAEAPAPAPKKKRGRTPRGGEPPGGT